MASTLSGKTLFITGASRGIGLAIGVRAARDGANVAIAAKTGEPHPKLPGTIYTAAKEIEAAGGRALPLVVDVRDEAAVRGALDETALQFGGIDIVVNNASAISLTDSQATDMKRFDLMHQINARGTFMVSKFAVPFLEKSDNPHILMLSPPLDLKEKWFAPNTAYTMAKYGMSLVVLGLAGELRPKSIAVNALWPRTTIATAAIKNVRGEAIMLASRTPDILADAAHMIFLKDAKSFSGNFLIDDTYLFENGVRDFDQYRVDPSVDLEPDFFVPDELGTAGQPSKDPVGPSGHLPTSRSRRGRFRPGASLRRRRAGRLPAGWGHHHDHGRAAGAVTLADARSAAQRRGEDGFCRLPATLPPPKGQTAVLATTAVTICGGFSRADRCGRSRRGWGGRGEHWRQKN